MTLSVDGHELPVTSLEKPLWPGAGRRKGATKRTLLVYLTRVAPYLLPHLADRPIFVTRFPDGVGGKTFFQKHWEPAPPFARTVRIRLSRSLTRGAREKIRGTSRRRLDPCDVTCESAIDTPLPVHPTRAGVLPRPRGIRPSRWSARAVP